MLLSILQCTGQPQIIPSKKWIVLRLINHVLGFSLHSLARLSFDILTISRFCPQEINNFSPKGKQSDIMIQCVWNRGLKICISTKFSGDTYAVGSGTDIENLCVRSHPRDHEWAFMGLTSHLASNNLFGLLLCHW
jgi:hypothetical protein